MVDHSIEEFMSKNKNLLDAVADLVKAVLKEIFGGKK